MKLKIFFATFSLLLLLSSYQLGYSQEIDDTSKVDVNVFQDFSFQFQVDFLELKSFQGTLVSFKYHINDHFAIRTGIGLSIDDTDLEEGREIMFTDSIIVNTKTEKERLTFSFPSQFLYYINPKSDIKVFIGVGPYFAYSISKTGNTDINYSEDYSGSFIKDSEYKNYSVGLSSVYGIEWFFRDNMGLTAEYGFTFSYFYDKRSQQRMRIYRENEIYLENSERKSEGWRLSSNNVLFGMSIYF